MFVRFLLVYLTLGALSIASSASPIEVGSHGSQTVQQHGKADSLLLTELPALVRRLTDKCLIEERTSGERALDCWQGAVEALDVYVKELRGPLIDQVQRLRSTWRQRIADLQLYRAKPVAEEDATVRPVSTRLIQSDPNRLAATAMCSSKKLGDYRACIDPPVGIGNGRYKFSLKAECTRGSVAAVSTIDEKGHCVSRVISLSAEKRSVDVSSAKAPGLLDAISFGGDDIYECYTRRHENVSCGGAIDYGESASFGESPAVKKRPRQDVQNRELQRRKKTAARNSQSQERVKKRQPGQNAGLKTATARNAPAESAWRVRSKKLKCFLTGRSCPPNT